MAALKSLPWLLERMICNGARTSSEDAYRNHHRDAGFVPKGIVKVCPGDADEFIGSC